MKTFDSNINYDYHKLFIDFELSNLYDMYFSYEEDLKNGNIPKDKNNEKYKKYLKIKANIKKLETKKKKLETDYIEYKI